MKRVLLRTVCMTVSALFLSAATLYSADFTSLRKTFIKQQSPGSPQTVLSITAPSDLFVTTNPYSGFASGLNLGVPLVSGDNGAGYTVTNNAPMSFPIGINTISWKVTDNLGNTAYAVQHITVSDKEKPIITRMGEISVVNDAGKCGAAVSLMNPYTWDNSGLPVSLSSDAPAFFNVGSTLITWTATDAFGNTDTSTQYITVIDNEVPVIQATNVVIGNSPGTCGATTTLATPFISDNCGIAGLTNNAPAVFPVGTTTVIWTATDLTGYTASTAQLVTVEDREKPVIGSISNLTVSNSPGLCGAMVKFAATAGDNCTGPVTISYSKDPGSLFPVGTTTVVVTAKDANGNIATRSFMVRVRDTEKPLIKAPADITITVNNNKSTLSGIALGVPVTSDNCSILSVSNNAPFIYSVGTANITWTVKDANSNTASAVQKVTLVSGSNALFRKNNQSSENTTGLSKEANEGQEELSVIVAPNPSISYFTLLLESKSDSPVQLKVTDVNGRLMDAKSKIPSNSSVHIGQNYPTGSYFAELIQGSQRKVIQLIKVK